MTALFTDAFSTIKGRQRTFVALQYSFKHTQVYKPLIILSVLRLKGLQADALLVGFLSPARFQYLLSACSVPNKVIQMNSFLCHKRLRMPVVRCGAVNEF